MYILGYPRSGNTWLCYLLAYCLNSEYDDLDEPGIHPRDPYQRKYVKGGLSHASYQDKIGKILKTHKIKLVNDHHQPVIYLVRDVRDVIVSYYYYLRGGTSAQMRTSETLSDFSEFARLYTEKWVDHVNHGFKISPDIILRYEDLSRLTHEVLASIFTRFKTAISERSIEEAVEIFNFKRLSTRDPGDENTASFFRKGIVGDWKNKLSESDIEYILSIAGDTLASLGYINFCNKMSNTSDQQSSISLEDNLKRKQNPKVKVVHLCTHDSGGAGLAALRLHRSLQKAGVDSQMLVMNKSSGHPDVKLVPFEYADHEVKCFDASYFESPLWSRQWLHWESVLSEYPDLSEGIEGFTDCTSHAKLDLIHEIQQADIIHLHWVAGLMDYRLAPKAFAGKPVVWTLHDMNAFTGGCHYAANCQKYKAGCGACPQLGSAVEEDLSRQISNQKYDTFNRLNLNIVTPSKWLADCAAQSRPLSEHPTKVIPNGFPLDIFKPGIRSEARGKMHISDSKKVILFGADSVENPRKGFKYLLEAINKLHQVSKHEICILTFGEIPEEAEIACPYPVYSLGKLETEEQVAAAYNAADVYVIPAIEDNLPNTIAEAMACGTPVVGFAAGGIPEMIEHQKTGYLVEPKNIDGLIEGIDWVLSADKRDIDFTKTCREKALTRYDSLQQAQAYHRLYQQLHQDSVTNVSLNKSLCRSAGDARARQNQVSVNADGSRNIQTPASGVPSILSQQKTITIATSIAPRDIEMQVKTVDSWRKLGFQVASLNCTAEIEMLSDSFPDVQFIRTQRNAQSLYGKPYIYFDDFLEFFKSGDDHIFGIVNSDVFLFSENGVIPHILKEAKNSMVYGSRVEIQSLENLNGEFYDRGFDFFFFDRSILSCFPESDACIGVTWWDYWAPLIPALNRIPIKKWASPFAFHIKHAVRWDDKQWHSMGRQVSNFIFGKRCAFQQTGNANNSIKLFDKIMSNSTRALFADMPIDSEKKARRSYEMLPRFGISVLAFLEKISTRVHYESAINKTSTAVQARFFNDGKKAARDLNEQGEFLLNQGDLKGALPYFLKALEMEPVFPAPHSNLGILHWKTGDAKNALHHFKKALEIQPDDEAATLFCGNMLLRNRQYAEAKKFFSFYLYHDPSNLEIENILSQIEKDKPSKNESPNISPKPFFASISRFNEDRSGFHSKKIMPESALAHKWLDGLQGLEIGPSAHNPFGLNTINVGLQDDIYEQEQITRAGKATPLDIIATADDIPVDNETEDFILGSHLIEHCPNFIKTFIEWFRIIKPGGYIFMITPHRTASPADVGRPLTSWSHLYRDYVNDQTADKEPEAGTFGHCHYHIFAPDLMKDFVNRVCGDRLRLVDYQKVDDKDGSGFTLVYQKTRTLADSFPWQISSGNETTDVRLTSI